MKRKKSSGWCWSMALLTGVLLLLTGCTAVETGPKEVVSRPETAATSHLNPAITAAAQQALGFYQGVTLDEYRAQVEASLGVTGEVQADGQVAYWDPVSGYGVLIVYGNEDAVFSKRLLPPAKAPELAALNPLPVSDKQAYRMAVGMPFYEVRQIMGSDGIEISLSRPEPGSRKQVTGLAWFNPDGSYAVVYLNLPEGLVVGSEFVAGPS